MQNARTAYVNGTATSEQLELLKNETVGEMYSQKRDEEKAQKPWNKLKRYLFQDLEKNEDDTENHNKSLVLEALNASKTHEELVEESESSPSLSQEQEQELDKRLGIPQSRSWKSWLLFWR